MDFGQSIKKVEKFFIVTQKQKFKKIVLYIYLEKVQPSQKHVLFFCTSE